jgi:hypothetical protein
MEDKGSKITERIRSVRDLVVYRKAFDAVASIFPLLASILQ